MFKVPKRKRPTVKKLHSSDDSDHDTEGVAQERGDGFSKNTTAPIPATKAKVKNKSRKLASKKSLGGGLSFNINEGDDFELHASKKKKKKGMGFGGMHALADFEDEQAPVEQMQSRQEGEQKEEEGGPTNTSKRSTGYSKEDLQKLKSQQKVYVEERTEDKEIGPNEPLDQSSTPINSSVPVPPAPSNTIPSKPNVPEEEEDYISFDSSTKKNGFVIMSGDDALQFASKEEDGEDNQDISQEIDEEGQKWEEEIIKRAGIGGSFADESTLVNSRQSYKTEHSFQKEDGRRAIEDIKLTIQHTLQNLNQQELDLETSILRKNHDACAAEEDATKKEKELSSIGKVFEYYQKLRSDVAAWTGALRHLSGKVNVIENALEELYRDLGRRKIVMMQEWQDDVASELHEKQWLDYAVGRQPILVTETQGDVAMVDEFGRDVKSMESLARSKRNNARKKRRAESEDRRRSKSCNTHDHQNHLQVEYEDTDLDTSDHEVLERVERRCALSDAIDVVLEDVEDEFRSIAILLSFFRQWEATEPSDYMQCYATLSLMDYISVFARAEFCKKLDLLCIGVENSSCELKDFDWFVSMESSIAFPQKHVIGKTCLTQIRMSLFGSDDFKGLFWSYDPFSTRQTNRLTAFLKSIISPNTSTDAMNALLDEVHDYINRYLQEMSFLICKKEASFPIDNNDSSDAINFASLGQIYRIKKLVSNIINGWYPLGNRKRFATLCFADILSYRFLPIFEALEPRSANFEQARDVFHSLWKSLMVSGLLDDEELLLTSSGIRAAALKLGFKLT